MDVFVERISVGQSTGVPVAVKDCIDVAGLPTRLGSRAIAQASPAARHAAVVNALLAGGYRVVGKAHMHEFAYGVTGLDSAGEGPVNPAFPNLIPGGSSSGSAVAVAAREAEVALGTDTGGSVRVPAACCGVFGLKPTFGRLSRDGVTPAASSLDCVGVFARSIRALTAAMAALDRDFHAHGCDVAKVARLRVSAEPKVQDEVDLALRHAPLEVMEAVLPSFEAAYHAGLTVIAAEAWAAFGRYANDPRVGRDVAERLRAAADVGEAELVEAERIRKIFTAEVDQVLETADVVVLPTLPTSPPRRDEVGEAHNVVGITALVRPFNLSGHPALTIPLHTPAGAPAGLQVVGRKGEDARLCGLAAALELVIPWVITDIRESA